MARRDGRLSCCFPLVDDARHFATDRLRGSGGAASGLPGGRGPGLHRGDLGIPQPAHALRAPADQAPGLQGHPGLGPGFGRGIRLAKPARDISLLDVVDAVEGGVGLNHCTEGQRGCPMATECPVQSVWTGATHVLEAHLGAVRFDTLALGPNGHVVAHQKVKAAARP